MSDQKGENWSLIVVLGILVAVGPLSIDMYLPAFSDIERSLGTTSSLVELSLAVFFLGFAFGQLLYGPITDRWGRRKPLYFGIGLYIIASIGAAFAWNIEALIFFRFLQAIGGCSGPVISRAIVRDLYDANHAARIFSLLMLVMGLAPILAPLLGGLVATGFGWRWIFGILAIVSLITWILAHKVLPDSQGKPLPVEASKPEKSARPSLSLVEILKNYKALLQDRRFIGYALSGSISQAGMFAYISGSPYVLIHLFGVPQKYYGLVFGLNAFGLIAAAQVNGLLLRERSFDRILRASYFIQVVIAVYLLWVGITLSTNFWVLAAGLFFFVGLLGFIGPNYSAGALSHLGRKAGSASALLGTLQFAIAFCASLLVSQIHDGTMRPMIFTMAACGMLPLLIYSLLIRSGRRQPGRH